MGWYSEHRIRKDAWEADEAERQKIEEQKKLQDQQQDKEGKP